MQFVQYTEEVQVVMGHASATMTQRYAHLGEDTIRRVVAETEAPTEAAPVAPAAVVAPVTDAATDTMFGLVAGFLRRVAAGRHAA